MDKILPLIILIVAGDVILFTVIALYIRAGNKEFEAYRQARLKDIEDLERQAGEM